MAVQSNIYSGTALDSKTFPSTKHISTKQHMAVRAQQISDDAWVQLNVDTYQLISNSCILNSLLNQTIYNKLEVRVADAPDELADSLTDIAILAAISEDITTVADDLDVIKTVAGDTEALNLVATDLAKGIGTNQPTDSSILNALTNATQTIADVVLTNADVVLTNADVVLTNADVETTNANVVLTNADVVTTGNTVADFDSKYVSSPTEPTPTLGKLWFDETNSVLKLYNGSAWEEVSTSVNGIRNKVNYVVGTASGAYDGVSTTTFPATYDVGFVDIFVDGIKLVEGVGQDFTATDGTTVVLTASASAGADIQIIGWGIFTLASLTVVEEW